MLTLDSRYLNSVLNVKAVVAALNQEKALVGAFSVIVQLHQLIVYSTTHHAGLQTAPDGWCGDSSWWCQAWSPAPSRSSHHCQHNRYCLHPSQMWTCTWSNLYSNYPDYWTFWVRMPNNNYFTSFILHQILNWHIDTKLAFAAIAAFILNSHYILYLSLIWIIISPFSTSI